MGTRWNRLAEAVLTSTQNLCFERKYEKYQIFFSENFHFLVVKFSVHLNRRVYVMVFGYKTSSNDSFVSYMLFCQCKCTVFLKLSQNYFSLSVRPLNNVGTWRHSFPSLSVSTTLSWGSGNETIRWSGLYPL